MKINPTITSLYGNTAATRAATSTEKTADFSLAIASEDKAQSKEQAATHKFKNVATNKSNVDAALSELELETNIRQIKDAMASCTDMEPVSLSTEVVNPDFFREYDTKDSIYDIPVSELIPRLEAALRETTHYPRRINENVGHAVVAKKLVILFMFVPLII